MRAAFPGTRWVSPEKLHLTLVFLGPTGPERVPAIAQSLTPIAGAHEALDVTTGEGGGRVNQWRGGVAWLRLTAGGREVAALALAVDDALGSATYGADRRPRPHLTVARGIGDEALAALREWSADRPPLSWRMDRLVLFRSHTSSRGSRYEELGTFPLIVSHTT